MCDGRHTSLRWQNGVGEHWHQWQADSRVPDKQVPADQDGNLEIDMPLYWKWSCDSIGVMWMWSRHRALVVSTW